KDQQAAGVVMHVVVFDNGVDRVFNLDAGDVGIGFAVVDANVARLADVERRVSNARGNTTIDLDACAAHRVDAVEARGVNLQVAEGDVAGVLRDDAVGD